MTILIYIIIGIAALIAIIAGASYKLGSDWNEATRGHHNDHKNDDDKK